MLQVYTDGSALGNPGPGGWGFIIVEKDIQIGQGSGGINDTTNNRMELQAVIEALKWLLDHEGVVFKTNQNGGVGLFAEQSEMAIAKEICSLSVLITTDSNYVKLGITEWIHTWIQRDRRLSKGGKMVKNADLWKELHGLTEYFSSLERAWTKAHVGHRRNEKVDDLARNAAGNFIK